MQSEYDYLRMWNIQSKIYKRNNLVELDPCVSMTMLLWILKKRFQYDTMSHPSQLYLICSKSDFLSKLFQHSLPFLLSDYSQGNDGLEKRMK